MIPILKQYSLSTWVVILINALAAILNLYLGFTNDSGFPAAMGAISLIIVMCYLIGGRRRVITLAALLLCVFAFNPAAKAQTYYNFTVVSGTNYAPILLHFATQSNLTYVPIQAQTLIVTNVITNETFTLPYGAQFTGQIGTNVFVTGSITTNLSAAWAYANFGYNTNQFSWTYPIPAYGVNVGVSPWGGMIINCTSNGPTLNMTTWTNGVGLQ